MLKKIGLFLIVSNVISFSQQIDQAELKGVSDKENTIKFNDYNGPENGPINTANEIKAIGVELANKTIIGGVNSAAYGAKYSIDILQGDGNGYSAVVFSIGNDSKIDRIANIRRILEGFLEAGFGYSAQDSATLSRFITVYNAVYRNNLDFFTSKYSKTVLGSLTKDKVGLSISYKEWAGYTQIVIPFINDVKQGSLTALHPSELVDSNTLAKVEKEGQKSGSNITDKQGMVELLNQTSSLQAQENAKKEQDLKAQAKENEKSIKDAQQTQAQAQQDAQKAQAEQQIAKEQQQAAKQSGDTKAEQEAKQKEEDAKKAEQEAKQKEEDAKKTEEDAKKTEEQRKAEQDKLDQNKDAQKANENKSSELTGEVVSSIQDKISQEDKGAQEVALAEVQGKNTYFMDTTYDTKANILLSKIILVSQDTGSNNNQSVLVSNIVNRTILDKNDGSMVALILDDANAKTSHLSLIKTDTLAELKTTPANIFLYSMIVVDKNSTFAITKVENSQDYVLTKFNQNLELVSSSIVKVDPYSSIKILSNRIYVKDNVGDIVVLDTETMRSVVQTN